MEQNNKPKFIGRQILKPGLSMVSYNYKTNEVKNLERLSLIDIEENCIYRAALNEWSFRNKLRKESLSLEN